MKKLEEIYEDHVQKIKRAIERKLKQARELNRGQAREDKGGTTSEQVLLGTALPIAAPSAVQVLLLKSELEAGLDLWRKQVMYPSGKTWQ